MPIIGSSSQIFSATQVGADVILTGNIKDGEIINADIAPAAGIVRTKLANISATSRVIGRKTAGPGADEELVLSDILDFIGSATKGDILVRDTSTWIRLAADVAGKVLTANGAGALPTYQTPASIQFGVCSTQGTKGTQSVGTTNYADSRGTNATETNIGDFIPVAGTFKNLMVNVLTNTFITSATTFTIMKNGSATGMTLSYAGGVTGIQSDITHTFAIAAGDRITLRAVTTNVDSATLTYVFAWQQS